MSARVLSFVLGYGEATLALVALISILRSKAGKSYWPLVAMLGVQSATSFFLIPWAKYASSYFGRRDAYIVYFYSYWIALAVESVLALVTIYTIYRAAMAPLKGLESLGILVFKWAAAISIVIALAVSIGPRVSSLRFIISAVSQMQRATGILTLSLLLFVCFAIRPMGLSYRSRIFGVSLGLGTMSTISMFQSAWISKEQTAMYNVWSIGSSMAVCAMLLIWSYYFLVPEPKRRFILLPTTSPFLRWNQISELLGHNPGYVALGGFTPDTFATAELEVLKRASEMMKQPGTPEASNHAA